MNSKVVCYTLVCFGVIGLAGCSEDPEFTAALDDQISALGIEFSVLPPVTFPVDNQVSDEKIALGKMSQSHKTIAEIAYQSGFNSPTYFTRVFKKRFGISPTDFIKQLA